MKSLTLILLTLITTLSISAQQDEKAKGILDKLSAQTKAYKTISAEFEFTLNNKTEGINEVQSGKIKIMGNQYVLDIKGQKVISNGKVIYTVLKDAEEVQINGTPDEDEEDFISPNKIFTLYEDGFKYKYVKEDNGYHIINLYPKDAEDKNYHRIALYVNIAKNQITKVIVYGKDGTKTKYVIKSFVPNSGVSEKDFVFDKTAYPKFEIIDLRD